MTRILLLAALVCSSAYLSFALPVTDPDTLPVANPIPEENVQMDVNLLDDSEQAAASDQDQLQERQFGLGFGGLGYGGLGLGYGGLGYGGYGGYGFGGGLCSRMCFGVGCRIVCRNRLFFDEDPEESQDADLSQDPSMEESDELQDPIFIEDVMPQIPENIREEVFRKEKKHKPLACGKNVEEKIDSPRIPPPMHESDRRRLELMSGSDSSSKWTESRIREMIRSGKKVVKVPHSVFRRLRPDDLLIKKTVKTTENVDPSIFTKHTSETNRFSHTLDSNRRDIPWTLGTNTNIRRETIEEANRLPSLNTEGTLGNMEGATSNLDSGKFIRVPEESLMMKKKHHRRPIVIIMDEGQQQQPSE